MASSVTLSGLASGIDYSSIVDQLIALERVPENTLRTQQSLIQRQNTAYTSLKTQIATLQSKLAALTSELFDSRQTSVSDTTKATTSATAGATVGTYNFTVTQLASAAALRGAADVGAPLNPADPFATAGTFTVNGQQLSVATTDSLQDILDNITAATGVTATYNAGADTITLASGSEIVLGSATDTSNFLTAARLTNNGTGAITSSGSLGAVKPASHLDAANFTTPITGSGSFQINGVTISYDAATDTVNDVLARINNSAAGVTASYDALADRFTLTNKAAGDIGFALADVSGNFLAATGLATGTLQRGQNLLYTVNGSDPRVSPTNTVTDGGLSVTVHQTGSFSVEVGADTAKIKTAITDFVDAYNKIQSLIETDTASSTDADGEVTAGLLAGERDVNSLAARLRSLAASSVSGLSGAISRLSQLGYKTSGYDNQLTLDNADALDSALTNNLADVKALFTTATTGIAPRFTEYLDNITGDEGWIAVHQDTLTKQSADIDRQIEAMERRIASDRERMLAAFMAMEQAQQRINAQMEYLTRQFNNNSSNS
jgi:flagellar hook-associated protein 2